MVAERSDIRAGITLDAEKNKTIFSVKNFKFVYSTNPESALYCTLTWGTLVQSPGKLSGNLIDSFFVHITVQPHKADIFLVMLEKKGSKTYRVAEHDKKQAGNLRVECSRVSYLTTEHSANPCCYLMAGRAPGFVYDEYAGMVPQRLRFSPV
jgi:hypothetical protein